MLKLYLKGLSKEAMRLIESFQMKDRYEHSPETTAIINAKYQ